VGILHAGLDALGHARFPLAIYTHLFDDDHVDGMAALAAMNAPVVEKVLAATVGMTPKQSHRAGALSEQLVEDLSSFVVFNCWRCLDLHELRPLGDKLQYLLGVRRFD
jgi:hypothetical protein